MRENLEGKLRALPRSSGVYIFRDADGDVLYVGKAKSLRSRVRSYFQRGDGRLGTAQLVERVDDVEVIVTRTEAEALHLEQNLVKRHRRAGRGGVCGRDAGGDREQHDEREVAEAHCQ